MIGKVKMISIFTLFLVFACKQEDSISYLSLSVNGQDGDTAYATAWEIDANGITYLHGGTRSVNKGNYSGKLSEGNLKKLIKSFSSLNLSGTKSFGSTNSTIGNYFEFKSRTENGSVVFLNGEYSKLSDSLYNFLENCYYEIKDSKLQSGNSIHSFKTKAYLKHNTKLRELEWEK